MSRVRKSDKRATRVLLPPFSPNFGRNWVDRVWTFAQDIFVRRHAALASRQGSSESFRRRGILFPAPGFLHMPAHAAPGRTSWHFPEKPPIDIRQDVFSSRSFITPRQLAHETVTNDRMKPVTNDRAQIINLEFTTDARNASDHLTMPFRHNRPAASKRTRCILRRPDSRPLARTLPAPWRRQVPDLNLHGARKAPGDMPPGLPGKMPRSCPQGTSKEAHPAGSS